MTNPISHVENCLVYACRYARSMGQIYSETYTKNVTEEIKEIWPLISKHGKQAILKATAPSKTTLPEQWDDLRKFAANFDKEDEP